MNKPKDNKKFKLRKLRPRRPWLWLLIVFCALVVPVEARIGVVMMESLPGTAGYVAQGGHSALFLTETCTDDFVSMRACTDADPFWGVIAERTATFSSKAKYDWLVMPASISLYAVEDEANAPLIVSADIRKKLIENFYFKNSTFRNLVVGSDPEFEKGMALEKDYRFPKGRWQNLLGSKMRRTLYTVWIDDVSGGMERDLVAAINGFSNRPKYNTLLFLFAGNCSKWVQQSLSSIEVIKEAGFGQNFSGDGIFTSPKGVTDEAFQAARKIMAKYSQVYVTVELIPQIPGTYPKSSEPYYVIESAFRNKLVWPVIAFFHPVYFLIGRFYFKFIKRFSIHSKYKNYFNNESARLSIIGDDPKYRGSKSEIKLLRSQFFGSKEWWKEKKSVFSRILKKAQLAGVISKTRDVKSGKLLKRLLDKDADIEIDQRGVPWLVRSGEEVESIRAGLTLDSVTQGNFNLGYRIMIARIGWHLKQKNIETRLPKEVFDREWNKLMEFVEVLEDQQQGSETVVAGI